MINLLLVLGVGIFAYSYGFVDFNLTLTSNPIANHFISSSQSLAMFNRPQSIQVYLAFIASLSLIYLAILYRANKNQATSFPWKPVIILALILSLSYPFLSHDIFKYLFSARMVLDYGLNPHTTSPDMVPGGDLWLRFMRWINTPSPYGPFMTALAIPYYLLGLKRFTPTFYLFKLDQAAWYLLSIWLIGKLAHQLKLKKHQKTLAQLFFALNPLVLVEWLVNAHNDAPMFTLLLASIYLASRSRRLLSLLTLALSAGIKYVTAIYLPFILIPARRLSLLASLYLMYLALALIPHFYHYQSQFQPWYLTWLVPFAALIASPFLMWATAAYTLGGLLRYSPFVATGGWETAPLTPYLLTYLPVALVTLAYTIRHLQRRKL